jgi:hypothetical protein
MNIFRKVHQSYNVSNPLKRGLGEQFYRRANKKDLQFLEGLSIYLFQNQLSHVLHHFLTKLRALQ